MLRPILILHRYLGVAVGALMTLWCLSGFVMMYQSFPELTAAERLKGLEPLRLDGCCAWDRTPLDEAAPIDALSLEMLAGRPVFRVRALGESSVIDARTGSLIGAPSAVELLAVATAYGRGHRVAGAPTSVGVVGVDQWNIQGARRNNPVHHFRFNDAAGTEIYISGATGEVFQDTNRKERVLSWFGAIPHWLYSTVLRSNGARWSQVVIWTATLGTFLTIAGLVVGLSRLKRRPDGRVSPYRGLWFWHHMTGLAFGVLTLTWVFSGLLTMNPWGLLESRGATDLSRLTAPLAWGQVKPLLAAMPASPGVAQLSATKLGGRTSVVATGVDAESRRLAADGAPSPLRSAELEQSFRQAGLRVAAMTLMENEDAYYYGHHSRVALPAYRVILDDDQRTRVYLDPDTAQVTRVVDEASRASRWLQRALHDLDLPGLRRRPVWDLVVLPLLAAVTIATAIGTWLGFLRIGRDLRALGRLLRRRGLRLRAAGRTQG